MTLDEIKEKARGDTALDVQCTEMYGKMRAYMQREALYATDCNLRSIPAFVFEAWCDQRKLPCFYINQSTVSIGKTYYDLLNHEEKR